MKEKIYIYVPKEIEEKLKADATMFEIYKSDGKNINRNRFLSMIIMGYYDDYAEESKKVRDEICSILKDYSLSDDKKNAIAEGILSTVIHRTSPQSRKGFSKLSLKPTNYTESLIELIKREAGASEFISRYFRSMFECYCQKPFSEREKIIFKDKFDKLEKYCGKNISITFNTIWKAELLHEVIPYKIIPGPEEMFNYLLCAEVNEETGTLEAKSFRLNRIDRVNIGHSPRIIDKTVKEHLDLMMQYGPAYAINDDIESCVHLTEIGKINYNRMYFGRPIAKRIEKKPDGTYYYYFQCSQEQVYLYFRKFSDAVIISPDSLRQKMLDFHMAAYKNYIDGEIR